MGRYFFSHKIIYDVLPALDSVGTASHFFRGGGIAAAEAAAKKEVK